MVLKRILFLSLGFFLFPLASQAMTPQKYCESLAATSCEVLNMDVLPVAMATRGSPSGSESLVQQSSHLLIKYCRNQKFRMAFYDYSTIYLSQGFVPNYDAAGAKVSLTRAKNGGVDTISVELSSAGLCGIMP
ncbi:hypothetical protein [Bdellovibrio sp.]|uniref:hypothetical protein n=1 Tax=Bdellovibrio sp. TaxID=28201 RepID=UPI0039E5D4D3